MLDIIRMRSKKMLKLSKNKKAAMDRLSADDGFIKALAIDQRGAMNRMYSALGVEATPKEIERLKEIVSEERSVEHTSELQSRFDIVCRLLLENNRDK